MFGKSFPKFPGTNSLPFIEPFLYLNMLIQPNTNDDEQYRFHVHVVASDKCIIPF